jgi:hypothetical protein
MTAHDERGMVDPRRFACLGNGYHAAVVIAPDGGTALWILSPDTSDHGDGHDVPAHERTGPLPRAIRVRLNRCQGRNHAGHRCGNAVRLPERLCHVHRGR